MQVGERKHRMKSLFKSVVSELLWILFLLFTYWVLDYNFPRKVQAHETGVEMQRIRQNQDLIIFKFEDAANTCYVSTTPYGLGGGIHTSSSISCVKR